MHGRPRKVSKPEEEEASAAKAEKLRSLQSQFLSNHQTKNYTKEAVDLSAKLLEINPEVYTAWNYRKLAVEHNLSQSTSDPDSIKLILDEELRVVESALRQNLKSYGAWHHRKWVLNKEHSSRDNEFRLLDKLLKADPRNFHAWNYRRFVAELMKRSEHDELKYTEDMIYLNFSNYSAWHNRSALLSNLLEKKVEGFVLKDKVFPEEYEFVHQAIFTDPDDQSGWFYHLWLLDQTVTAKSPLLISSYPVHGSDHVISGTGFLDDGAIFSWTDENFCSLETHPEELNLLDSFDKLDIKNSHLVKDTDWRMAALVNEIECFRELLSLTDCKIGKLTLAKLLTAHDVMGFSSAKKLYHSEEVLQLYSELMTLDPSHRQYYKDQHSLALLQQVTSTRESLSKHCYSYRKTDSFHCLRLNNLLLSRIGSMENLSWVRMLDLSQNEIQSADGLDGMQLLTCLNLSNNRLSSFCALEPLRQLKHLKVLDISCNQIGEHSIDTRRYLCSSPFSHTAGSEWRLDDKFVADYWDAFFILRELKLQQLDVKGNAIAGEKFKLFVTKVVPTLTWLDAQKVS